TGFQPKRSGSTLAGPAPKPPIALGRTRNSLAHTLGTGETAAENTIKWARESRTPGVCTTCMAMWPNGHWTNTYPIFTVPEATPKIHGRRLPIYIRTRCVAGIGRHQHRHCGLPHADNRSPNGNNETHRFPKAIGG